MSASDSVRVVPIPAAMVPAMWDAALPHLVRGNRVAKLDPVRLLVDLVKRHAVLWCVFVDDELLAAYFSSVVLDDDGRKSLMVYGLGGRMLSAWLNTMICKMEAHAMANGCTVASFHGVRGWSRLVPQYQAIPAGDGVALYQRVLI